MLLQMHVEERESIIMGMRKTTGKERNRVCRLAEEKI